MAADVTRILRVWEDLKSLRQPIEPDLDVINRYFMSGSGFSSFQVPGEIVRRRTTSSTGPRSLARGAAMLVAYMIDPSRPFVGPNVDRGMAQAGRSLALPAEGLDYLDTVQWAMFDRMLLPQSGYLASTARCAIELMGYSNCVRWTGRKRGFGPRYQSRPFRSCWFAENEDGEVDTMFFRFTLPAWRVLERYPEAQKNDRLRELASNDSTAQSRITLLHVVQPRRGGRPGAFATSKPFEEATVAVDQKAVLEEGGYDSFPYSVARIGVQEGGVYGTGGPGSLALADVKAINWLQQCTEMSVGLRALPPTMSPGRMFGKPLDLRPGANNIYDPARLGFQKANEAFQQINLAGDPFVTVQYIERLERSVEEIFFIDWMRDNGVQKTATEVIDRRDLRVRAMTALVPSVDRDLIGKDADRTLEVLIQERQLPPPPRALSGVEVDWDYKGPLALMAQRGQVEAISTLFDLAIKSKAIDDAGAEVVMVAEGLRAAAEALGTPIGLLRSREDMEKALEEAAARVEAANDLSQAQQSATALRDAGQGLASLADGNGGGRPANEGLAA